MSTLGQSVLATRLWRLAIPVLATTTVAALPATAVAKKRAVGAVYTETNGTGRANNANQLEVYTRYSNGTLKHTQTVRTGGSGGHQIQPGFTVPAPILDTQSEVVTANGGHLVFAVNAGSNTISSFTVDKHGKVRLAGRIRSGGKFPSSITIHGNRLYVLNINSFSIAGFTFTGKGRLKPIAGSKQALVGNSAPGLPRQIGIDNTGKTLVVTLLVNPEALAGTGPPTNKKVIDTFAVHRNGSVGPAVTNDASSLLTFGFTFDHGDNVLVTQLHAPAGAPGDVGSYRLTGGPALAPIQTPPLSDRGSLPCWIVVTNNGKYAYVVNTGGRNLNSMVNGGQPSVSIVKDNGGTLSFVSQTANISDEFIETDDALSPDSKYLYVLAPLAGSSAHPGNASHIDIYKVHGDGSLTLAGKTPNAGAAGDSGLAAS